MPQRSRNLALLETTLAVVFWGASFVATKIALNDAQPMTIVWLRFSVGVFILGVAVVKRREWVCPPLKELAYFALLGFIGITFHQWLQANALLTSQANTAGWLVATTPVFIVILSRIFLHEHLGWMRALGIAAAVAGALLVVTRGDWKALANRQFGTPGDTMILISSVNWAVFTVLSRRALRLRPAALMIFYVMLFGWLFSSVLFFAGPGWRDMERLTGAGWIGVLFLSVFCSGLAYIFWFDALKIIPASQLGAFLYLEPLVTVVVAALLLNERLPIAAAVGGLIILSGVWLVSHPARH